MKRVISSERVNGKSKNIAQACKGNACALCVKECLMLKMYMQSPKEFFNEILEYQTIDPIIPFSCTQCGHCERVCPEALKPYDVFHEMKKALQETSRFQPVLRSHYNVYFHQKMSQTKLVKGASKGRFKRAFMPGCSLSAYSPKLVEKTYAYLKEIDSSIGTLTNCCNKPLEDLGHQSAFDHQMNQFIDEITARGIEEIIVGCQNCYDTLKKEYPELIVTTIWHIFDKEGLPEISKANKLLEKGYVIHDPCPVENTPEIKHIIRRILKKLGCKIENDNIDSYAKCCGLGAMAGVSNGSLAKKVTNQRIKDLNNERIINYCAACTEVMGREKQGSYHLLELIFNLPVESNNSTIKKWVNRCVTKQKIT